MIGTLLGWSSSKNPGEEGKFFNPKVVPAGTVLRGWYLSCQEGFVNILYGFLKIGGTHWIWWDFVFLFVWGLCVFPVCRIWGGGWNIRFGAGSYVYYISINIYVCIMYIYIYFFVCLYKNIHIRGSFHSLQNLSLTVFFHHLRWYGLVIFCHFLVRNGLENW